MIENYTELSTRQGSWLKRWSSGNVGSPHVSTISKKRSYWQQCLFFLTFLFVTVSFAQTVTIGSGASTSGTSDNGSPIYRSSNSSSFNFSQSVHLVSSSKLSTAGILPSSTITSMAFYKSTASTLSTGRTATLKIYMKNSSATALVTTQNFATWVSGATLVYNNAAVGPADLSTIGANTFTFSTPFNYSGGAIEIAWDWSINTGTGNPTTGSFLWTYDSASTVSAVGTSNSSAITSNLSSGLSRSYRMNLTYTAPLPCSGTPAPGNTISSNATPCFGNVINLSLQNNTPGSGVTYQWYNTGGAISGATSSTYSPIANEATSYYCAVTCSGSTTNSTPVAISPSIINTFPFLETFDASSTTLPCWGVSAASGATYQWAIGTSDSTHGAGAPAASTSFAFLNVYNASATYNTYNLFSPTIALDATAKRLRYNYYLGTGGYQTTPVPLAVAISINGAPYTTIYSHTSANSTFATASDSPWQSNTIDLSAYVGQNIKLAFVSNSNFGSGFCNQGLDEVIVENIPACAEPSLLVSSGISDTSATISWTASPSSPTGGYDYYYSTTNTAPDGATTPSGNVAAGIVTKNITGLTANTQYYYWVRSNCGVGGNSPWIAGASFTTACVSITTFPWTENFESVTAPALPNCWSQNDANGDGDKWITYTTYGVGSSIAAGLYTDFNSGANNDYLILPRMTLTGNQRLKFFVRARSTSEPNDYRVVLSTTGNQPADFTNVLLPLTTVSSTTMTEISPINLAAYSGDVYIAIHVPAGGLDGYYIYVDDFTVEQNPSCVAPSAPTVSNITGVSATINWTASSSNPSNGYDYYYDTTNTAPTVGTTPSGNVAAGIISKNLTGLTAQTIYYYWVRANCGGGDTSTWVAGGSFSTPCNATDVPYVQDFESVTVPAIPVCGLLQNAGTGNNWVTSSNPGSGFTSKTLQYTYNSSSAANAWYFTQGINLTGGTSYAISYKYGNNSTTYVEKLKVAYGNSPINSAMTTQLFDHTSIVSGVPATNSVTFTPATTGVYYFGFNAYSDADQFYLFVDDISVLIPCSSANAGTISSVISSSCPGATGTISSTGYGVGAGITYEWEKATDLAFTTPVSASAVSSTYANLATGVLNTTTYFRLKSVCSAGTPAYSNIVTVVINTPATITASTDNTNFCVGGSANISASGASSYTWTSAPAGFTSTSASNVVSPTVTTTYSVVGVDANGCTTNTVNVPVTILLTPSPVTVTSSASPVCVDTIVHLTKTGGTVTSSGNVSIGTQTTTEFGGGVYRGGFGTGDFRHQLLFTQAELNAAGITASNLTSIAFNVTSVGSGAMNNYQIKLASVPTTALTSTFDTASFTTVYNAATYSAVSGVNLHTFDTPFAWNGTSNVIVEICYNVSSIGGSSTLAATTPAVISNTNLLGSVGACTALTGSTYANRPLATFGYNIPVAVTTSWTSSPASTLYTDAAASIAYTPGADAASVYAKPTVQTTYTATATNGTCSSAPASVVVDVNPLPVFSIAPTTICSSDTATLTVATSESNSYSWTPVGGGTTITGATVMVSPTVTTTYNVTATSNTTVPACQKTNQVTVTVNEKGTIVSGTTSRTVSAGQPTTFVVNTTGSGLSYQWQVNDGSGWVNLSNDYVDEFTGNYLGVTTATLSVQNIDGGFDGYQYQCLVTGQAPCATLTPIVATLTVSNTGFATQPADVNLCGTTSTSFTIVTTGDEPFFVQWQMSTDGGVSYVDITDGFDAGTGLTFAGANDLSPKTLSVSGITPTNDGLKFKAQLDFFTESNVATLTVNTPVSFDTNVSTTPINVCQGVTSNNLSFVASGSIASIKWKYATSAGGTYTDVVNGTPLGATYSNDTTQTLTVATTAATPVGAYYYKAFLVGAGAGPNKCPDVESNVATLMVNKPTVAIAASQTSYCTPGAAVTLTASGASTYSWSSVPTGFTSSSAAISVTPSESTSYTVIGTDGFGCTNTATQLINVGASFTVTSANANGVQCPGDVVNLSSIVTPAGGVVYNIATGANSRNYSFTAVAGTFTPLVGATPAPGIITTSDDDVSTNITPGFTFNYGGTNYTDLRVSSNGHLIFGTSGTSSFTNNLATSTSTQRPGLAPLWDDLQCTAGISYLVSGTAPNRVLTIEWLDMEWNYASNTAVVSYQVKLYETTNVIEYVYRQDATAVNSGSASIGLMGTASANFMSLSDSSASPSISTSSSTNTIGVKPATGQVYRFTPSLPI